VDEVKDTQPHAFSFPVKDRSDDDDEFKLGAAAVVADAAVECKEPRAAFTEPRKGRMARVFVFSTDPTGARRTSLPRASCRRGPWHSEYGFNSVSFIER
jgi:hypothetical protein